MITLKVSYPQLAAHRPGGRRRAPAASSSDNNSSSNAIANMSQHHHLHHHHHTHNPKHSQPQAQQHAKREADVHHSVSKLRAQGGEMGPRETVKVEQLFENLDSGAPAQATGSHGNGKTAGVSRDSPSSPWSQGQRRGSSKSLISTVETSQARRQSALAAQPSGTKLSRKSLTGVGLASRRGSATPLGTEGELLSVTSYTSRGRRSSMGSGNPGIRVTGDDALKQFAPRLTDYEKTEITQFRTVYYLGQMTAKRAAQSEGEKNNNFDDREGFLICKPRDHLLYRYEIQELLGTGTFGQVVKALDHKNRAVVAVKIVKNERPFQRQAREEIRILETLRKLDIHDNLNVVHILDSFNFRGHVCISFELLGVSLHQLLRKTKKQGFSLGRVQRLTRGILRCLEVLYRNRIVHCDLKPENILLRRHVNTGSVGTGLGSGISDWSIKIIDFGSSCYEQQQIYSYIQSRYYRAPEVILGTRYTCAIDMWSLACVMGELLIGEPLFAGEDEFDQLACIMEVRGIPPRTLLDRCKCSDKHFTAQGQPRYLSSGTRRRAPPMSVHLTTALKNCEDSSFLDFMRRALTWDPAARLTPVDALTHPWVARGGAGRGGASKDLDTPASPASVGAFKVGGGFKMPESNTKLASATKLASTKSDISSTKISKSTSKKGGVATNNNSTTLPQRPSRPHTSAASARGVRCTVSVVNCAAER